MKEWNADSQKKLNIYRKINMILFKLLFESLNQDALL